jgi:hypothetical protein
MPNSQNTEIGAAQLVPQPYLQAPTGGATIDINMLFTRMISPLPLLFIICMSSLER